MNRYRVFTITGSLLLLMLSVSAYSQSQTTSNGSGRTQTKQLPAPNLDPVNPEERKPTCSTTIEQFPELRGFRLGMAVEQVQQRFPGVQFTMYSSDKLPQIVLSPVRRGFESTLDGLSVRPYSNTNIIDPRRFPGFEGVSQIELTFVNNRITTIEVDYLEAKQWRSIDDFINALTNKLNLPNAWDALKSESSDVNPSSGIRTDSKSMPCVDFQITVSMKYWVIDPDNPIGTEIKVSNGAAEKIAIEADQQRKIEAEEKEKAKKRESFKP